MGINVNICAHAGPRETLVGSLHHERAGPTTKDCSGVHKETMIRNVKNLLGPVQRIYGDLPVAPAEISLSNYCVLKAYVPNLSEEVPDRRKAAAIVFTLISVYWDSIINS